MPLPTTLATALPLIEPIAPLAITAAFAGPPRAHPATQIAASIKAAHLHCVQEML